MLHVVYNSHYFELKFLTARTLLGSISLQRPVVKVYNLGRDNYRSRCIDLHPYAAHQPAGGLLANSAM